MCSPLVVRVGRADGLEVGQVLGRVAAPLVGPAPRAAPARRAARPARPRVRRARGGRAAVRVRGRHREAIAGNYVRNR